LGAVVAFLIVCSAHSGGYTLENTILYSLYWAWCVYQSNKGK
jgi:hypothetical protein